MARKPDSNRAAKRDLAEMPEKPVTARELRRMRGLESATLPMRAGVAKIMGRRGFAEARIVTRWPDIAGEALARQSCPDKITRRGKGPATLTLRVGGAAALEVQHRLPQIIERINAFFGFEAIARIALVQGPVPAWRVRKQAAPAPLPPESRRWIIEQTSAVRDDTLREALTRLGEGVARRGLAAASR